MTVGVYGLLAFTMAQRLPEIGVRLTLGATRRQIHALVLRAAGTTTVVGLGIGLAAALEHSVDSSRIRQQESDLVAKRDVHQGTLALMVLKTLEVLGPLHGYGIARRIEQISGDLLAVNQGTLYPVLLKLEQEGAIASEWGTSENNLRARFYRLTTAGRRRLRVETQEWAQTTALMDRFIAAKAEELS